MVATVVPGPPWCPTPGATHTTINPHVAHQVYLVKTKNMFVITFYSTILVTMSCVLRVFCVHY